MDWEVIFNNDLHKKLIPEKKNQHLNCVGNFMKLLYTRKA